MVGAIVAWCGFVIMLGCAFTAREANGRPDYVCRLRDRHGSQASAWGKGSPCDGGARGMEQAEGAGIVRAIAGGLAVNHSDSGRRTAMLVGNRRVLAPCTAAVGWSFLTGGIAAPAQEYSRHRGRAVPGEEVARISGAGLRIAAAAVAPKKTRRKTDGFRRAISFRS